MLHVYARPPRARARGWFHGHLLVQPRSLPYFFASLKIAITLSFVGLVIAEIVAGNRGIGHVMLIAGSDFNVPLVFGALLVVGAMGTLMYAVFALLEHRFTGWSVRGLEYPTGG